MKCDSMGQVEDADLPVQPRSAVLAAIFELGPTKSVWDVGAELPLVFPAAVAGLDKALLWHPSAAIFQCFSAVFAIQSDLGPW